MVLHQASAMFDPLVTSVEVLSKPKAVLASAVFSKGQLVLVPATAKLTLLRASDRGALQSQDFDLRVDFDPAIDRDVRVFLAPTMAQDFVSPAWHVQKIDIKASATMKWTRVVVNLYTVTESQKRDASTLLKVTVPAMVNCKNLKKGDRLSIYELKKQPVDKRDVLSLGKVVDKAMKKSKK